MKVNKFVKGAVRQFSYWFAHGTIGSGLLNGIDYTSSLREESSFAEQAFIIFPLTSYSSNLRNEIKKGVKYYFWDNGIRNAVLNDFTPIPQRNDVGALWENYAISERLKKNSYNQADGLPFFWRTTDQMEVDYLEVLGSNINAVEFKWNPKKKSRVSKAFTNRYPDAKVDTITPENFAEWVG